MHTLGIIALFCGFLGIVAALSSFTLPPRRVRVGLAVAASLIVVCVAIIGDSPSRRSRSVKRWAEAGTDRNRRVATNGAVTATTTLADDPTSDGRLVERS